MKKIDKVKQGKSNRKSGSEWERTVRHDLEESGWIVSKWMNQVELLWSNKEGFTTKRNDGTIFGKLIPAKHKFNPFNKIMTIGTGLPDFICFRKKKLSFSEIYENQVIKEYIDEMNVYEVIGVEAKSNGYLDKEEKEKIEWLLKKGIFSKIIIAMKDKKKRGGIIYKEYGKG